MLENKRNVIKISKKIIVLLIAIMVILGIYMKVRHMPKELIEKSTIGINKLEPMKTSNTVPAIDLDNITINPIYRPQWTKERSYIDEGAQTLTVVVRGYAYESDEINSDVNIQYSSNVTSTLSAEDIKVFINGTEVTSTTHPKVEIDPESTAETITNSTSGKREIRHKIVLSNFEEAVKRAGILYKDWSGNVQIRIAGRGESPDTYQANVLYDEYTNQNMMETDESGTWIDVLYKDPDSTTNKNENNVMFADFVQPELIYQYSTSDISYEYKTLTVVFKVIDQYLDNYKTGDEYLKVEDLNIRIDGSEPDWRETGETTGVTRTLTSSKIEIQRNGAPVTIGHTYTLVLSNIQQDPNDAFKYSGIVSVGIPAEQFRDLSKNKSKGQTITVGIDGLKDNVDPSGKIVDVVDPIWKIENTTIDKTNKKVTVDLIGTDKYYKLNTLTPEAIQIEIDGEPVTTTLNVKKQFTSTTLLPNETGVRYRLEITDWEEATKQTGKDFFEWSGTTKITIPATTIQDKSDNWNDIPYTFTLGHVDFIKPKIEKVSAEVSGITQIIKFNVIDKYLYTSETDETGKITDNEISVYVDGELASSVRKQLRKTQEITKTINGAGRVVLQEYELVLSDFEQSSRNSKDYKNWSGKVSIEIAQNAIKDTEGNYLEADVSKRTVEGVFIDVIKPDLEYIFQTSDINEGTQTYTMTFDVTDKYYTSGRIQLSDLTIQMQNGQYERELDENGEWQYKLNGENKRIPIVYDLKQLADQGKINLTFNYRNKTAENVKVTNADTGAIETVGSHMIGHTYTITVSKLEQLFIEDDLTTANYSGIITVAIPRDIVKDRGIEGDGTTPNGNNPTTITSGIDIKAGGGTSTEKQEIDFVLPRWDKISSSAYAIDPANPTSSTATITFKGTDTYFRESTLTIDEIQVIVDGEPVTAGITKTLDNTTELKEDRLINGVNTANVIYGFEYTVTIKGFKQDANQVKIRIPGGEITDQHNNESKETDFILYNVLKKEVDWEEYTVDSDGDGVLDSELRLVPFLGESVGTTVYPENVTSIEFTPRTKIGNIIFVDSLSGSKATGVKKVWDVSAQGDKSILAWTSQNANETSTVYIGSDNEIFANQDSSSLFRNIGYEAGPEETITNLQLLNTTCVTNMSQMFRHCGVYSMKKLDLGINFDTSNVTNMSSMFSGTGEGRMTEINLGTKFDTSKVTNMMKMFNYCGYSSMTSLNLGSKFDTSNVIYMHGMFVNCGYTSMTSLNLGSLFDTGKVKYMNNMFEGTGYTALTELNLGASFKTNEVLEMSNMFLNCGYNAMTKLDLGDNFNTSKVSKMDGMFENCGYTSMVSLDLGNLFNTSKVTTMRNMFKNCGYTKLTSLELGDKFDTRLVTDMSNMFNGTGHTVMTKLDLGPIFVKIPNGTIPAENGIEAHGAHDNIFVDVGKTGDLEIFAPESIYSNKAAFKLNSTDTTSTTIAQKIIPKYRPTWRKEGSTTNTGTKQLTVTVTGSAYKTESINEYVAIKYASNVTSTLAPEDIKVYINGTDVSNVTHPKVEIDPGSTAQITTNGTSGKTEVTHKIVLSNFEEATRRAGIPFKEWSGNVQIRIGGRGQATSTYAANVLKDEYGNQNMMQTDEDGNWIDVKYKDTDSTTYKNENGRMFTDFVKPEFTYKFSETVIGSGPTGDKKVKITFDVVDKYFASTTLSGLNADLITVEVDDDEVNSTVNVRKTLRKIDDIEYNVNGNSTHKIGERYELTIEGLDKEDGYTYSGPMTIAFAAGTIEDLSGNESDYKSITIGIDDPETEGGNNTEEIVDVVSPIWVGLRNDNTIDRTTDKVTIIILGSDKYYASDVFAEDLADGTVGTATLNKIKVYVDDEEKSSTISKSVTAITDNDELQTLATKAGITDAQVGYKITLGNFGNQPTSLSGITKIELLSGTITDESGNINKPVTIYAGNESWVENNEPLEPGNAGFPRYPAFRNDIVDFIDPVIKYTYSTVEVDTDNDGIADSTISANPDIDYDRKQVTVKFVVYDKYFLESDLMKDGTDDDGNAIKLPKNIDIVVGDVYVYKSEDDEYNSTITEVKSTISATDKFETVNGVENTLVGKEYTLVVSNLEYKDTSSAPNTYPGNTDGFLFSGPMHLTFKEDAIEDKSGNKNDSKTISLDTHVDQDVVDVVDPVIRYETSSIIKTEGLESVTVKLRAQDKYISSQTLSDAEALVKVRVQDEFGNDIVNDTTTINKEITRTETGSDYMLFTVVLTNFDIYEGKTSIIIPAGVIKDTSGNGNVQTEIFVGNPISTNAFKDSIVDFTEPVWEYVTSSINRDVDANNVRTETGTVTLEVKGTDIYFDKDTYFTNVSNQLDLSQVNVYIDDVLHSEITKTFATNNDGTIKKEYIEESKVIDSTKDPDYSRVLKGVKYTLILGNFGTNEGKVRIEIPKNAIKDISNNGNILTPIDVGNSEWIETVGLGGETEDVDNPKYTAFSENYVDYIKPVIKYQYEENVNPLLNRTSETVDIIFTVTDTNFLESNIGYEDLKIYIDGLQVYGTGVSSDVAIDADLSSEVITEGSASGLKYTLRLSELELNRFWLNEIFERHSGVIKIVIAANQIADTSGNKNNEKTIIVDTGDGDDLTNGIIVDFVNPNIDYHAKYTNWEERYALVTVRATDRFYDTATTLKTSDLTFYAKNYSGQYVQVTNIQEDDITITPIANSYGKDFVIRIDNFEKEYDMMIKIKAGAKDENGIILNGIGDTSGNLNDEENIYAVLDNKKPTWEYINTDITEFESSGTISFNVKGLDRYLKLANSNLDVTQIKVLKDGEIYLDGTDETDASKITISTPTENTTEKSKRYNIKLTGLTEMGTYSLVFEKDILVDDYGNKSAATTISFSNAVIAGNTPNYVNVTYHVSPDMETRHKSYVHELMSVNTTGTNYNSSTYRPSTLGELFNNGENPLFAEPMYIPNVNGYSVSKVYQPKAFAGWAECDYLGNVSTGATVYGLYDEISEWVTDLKAVWQDAKVVFVSSESGDDSNFDGTTPDKPVKTLLKAYELIDELGTAESNIIVIMDEVEFDSNSSLNGNATITNVYGGVDYREQGGELKVSSDMIVNGDIIFDNIELYVDSVNNELISNYSGDITLGRGITTPNTNYTFGNIIGGKIDSNAGYFGTHTIRVEAGKYKKIIAGSSVSESDGTNSVTHELIIGNMKDAAISNNNKLIVEEYVAIAEGEKSYPDGATTEAQAYNKSFANVTLYSGTISSADTAIYLRSISGQTDGLIDFKMYGGNVTGNIYGGSRLSSRYKTRLCNTMNFYGGKVTGEIFGQGLNDTFTASSTITLQGNVEVIGNVYGGSDVTSSDTSVGEGDSTIIVNSASTKVNGNIYGGAKVSSAGTSYITGSSNITLNAGTVNNIYGSGYNCGNSSTVNITVENGVVNQNIYGGAFQNQAKTISNINVLGGTIQGNIYGGNNNTETQFSEDTVTQNVKIIIGDTETEIKPTIKGVIYGSGKNDKVNVVDIELLENTEVISVFGGSDSNATTTKTNIYLKGITANEIYGGSKEKGTVETSNINLQTGTVADVFGGAYLADVTKSNVVLEGDAIVENIYGGPNAGGKVTTSSNITLKSGTVINVFGGGISAEVETANITLDGVSLNSIYGGSKDAGLTKTTNITLKTGEVTNVFGGGLGVGVTTANINQQGAKATNIYGGSSGGDTGTTKINILNSTAENVYGGNHSTGTTRYATINIHGTTSKITGKLYGGGYMSSIGKSGQNGNATINIAGATILGDINGGSEQSVVYGATNINIGKDATDNASTSLTAGNIEIKGTIYGAGSTEETDYDTISVQGNTYIILDNSTTSPITYHGSIFGGGKGSSYSTIDTNSDNSTIQLKDFGTETNTYDLVSIERTGKVYIGNSFIELIGRYDNNNLQTKTSYTLNKISKGLIIYEDTTLYTQRGFNKVEGFYSYVDYSGPKATTANNNKLYTLEGVNLIFAQEEGNLNGRGNESIWSNVNGMTFFGMYTKDEDGNKLYDESLFKIGTYVEGNEKSNHNIEIDGFYKNSISGTPEVIRVDDKGTYYRWIIGQKIVNYEAEVIGSLTGRYAIAEVSMTQNLSPEMTYTLVGVSTNALVNSKNIDVKLIDPLTVPIISENANNTFGLTMETDSSGWHTKGTSNIYTKDDDLSNGTFDGDTVFKTDSSEMARVLRFRLYNSLNITQDNDLGFVNIILEGEDKNGGSPVTVVISVNIKTIVEHQNEDEYIPTFTNRIGDFLEYTTDSRVDLSYILFKTLETSPFEEGIEYHRTISTSTKLPAGTKLTMKDYGQGGNLNKVYYYHVTNSTPYDVEIVGGKTRYIYKLNNFIEMGSTDSKYEDSNSYYHEEDGYILEKYDISIDFINSGINTNLREQETYLELREVDRTVKFDNGDTRIRYNLLTGKNAEFKLEESNSDNSISYSVVEELTIPMNIFASVVEQPGVLDTKYHGKKAGIAIQIVSEEDNGERVKSPELQNFKLTNTENLTEIYLPDSNGVIRMPIMSVFGSKRGEYELSITQANVTQGSYKVQVILFTSDDGTYIGNNTTLVKEFGIRFINKYIGQLGVEATDDSRIINKSTGTNLTGTGAIDMTVTVGNPADDTNVRIELYKRKSTYTDINDETTYTQTEYELVDISQYLEGSWTKVEGSTNEYMLSDKKTYAEPVESEQIEFERALKEDISTGEYKLVFKAYSNDTLVQTFKKTFIVTP